MIDYSDISKRIGRERKQASIPKSERRVYIAGKVTGEPLTTVTAKFGMAQKKLEAQGYEVVNPLAVVADATKQAGAQWLTTPWPIAMRHCITALCTCNFIYLLPCALESKGACLEMLISDNLGIERIWAK